MARTKNTNRMTTSPSTPVRVKHDDFSLTKREVSKREVVCLHEARERIKLLTKEVDRLTALNVKLSSDNREHLHRRRELMKETEQAKFEADRLQGKNAALKAEVNMLSDHYDLCVCENKALA